MQINLQPTNWIGEASTVVTMMDVRGPLLVTIECPTWLSSMISCISGVCDARSMFLLGPSTFLFWRSAFNDKHSYIYIHERWIKTYYSSYSDLKKRLPCIQVHVDVALEVALSRNASRSSPVLADSVIKIFSAFQSPSEVFAFDRHHITLQNDDSSPARWTQTPSLHY